MVHHMTTHDLMPVFQSAYREGHSTETALIKIRNDILMNMNNQEVTLLVLLVLLDLSAAFDTIDHTLLLRRLQSRFGFTGTALAWLRSYLSNRFQYVVIDDTCSNRFDLSFGVPQGSCLGPLLFSIYTTIPVNCLTLLVITYRRYIAMLMILNSTWRSNPITMLLSLLRYVPWRPVLKT